MDAVFDVKVTGLKTETLPELDDEFAAKIEPGKTLEDIKTLISDDIGMRQKRQIEEIKVNAVLVKLNDLSDFDIPEDFMKSEILNQANSLSQEGLRNGLSEEELKEQESDILEEAEERAESSLKTNFLLTEIAEKEGLKVEQSELLQRITLMAKQAKKPLKGFTKEIQKNGQLDNIHQNMLFSKSIDFLVEHATVTEVEPETETED